jgi:iron complex outermembrane receptor protein
MSKKQCACGLAAGVIWTIAWGAASAQSTPPNPANRFGADPQAESLDEIIVTATRRDTKLKETPVAETVVTGAAIEREHLVSFSDIAQMSPSLIFTERSATESYLSIRGTSVNNDAAGASQGVSVFIDDVPMIGVGDNSPDLFDLQSVEVLRGPQGTLFGRNVTGGAVVVHTLPPSFTPSQVAQVTYGNYNLVEGRTYVTGPLIPDQLAGKISLDAQHRDGYLDDPYLPEKPGRINYIDGRTQALWTPTDALRMLVGADFKDDTSSGRVTQLDGNYQPHLFPTLHYGSNDMDAAYDPTQHIKVGGGLARVDYTLPSATLTSISGFRSVDETMAFGQIGDPTNEIVQYVTEIDEQYTEELHLTSQDSRRLTWVGGLFFLYATKYYNILDVDHLVPGITATYVVPYSALDFTTDRIQHIHEYSSAAFGEAAYALTPSLKLTLGGRFTVERKTGTTGVPDTSGTGTSIPESAVGSYGRIWRAFDPKVLLSYNPNHNVLAYATIASGFKSGGFDTAGTTAIALRQPFQPEHVVNYEVGEKITALDNRLVVDTAIYYANYKDLQVQSFNQVSYTVQTGNAGSAKIPGVELETIIRPWDWLTVNANYAYIGANYTKYVAADGSFNYTGHQIPFVSKTHFHLGADAHFLVPQLGGGEMHLGGDVTYASKIHMDDANDELPFLLSQTIVKGLLNLHLHWSAPGDTWEWSLWAKNVTGERSVFGAIGLNAAFADPLAGEYIAGNNIYLSQWTPPTTVGISITLRH